MIKVKEKLVILEKEEVLFSQQINCVVNEKV
jgi:hypothetical protein